MRTAGILIPSAAMAVAMIGLAGARAARPDSAPASRQATPPELLAFVKAIREANTLSAAAQAYTGGCAIDRNNVELNAGYMRRLLQLGLPQAAKAPALTLVARSAADGLAYAVAGYGSGRQNDLPGALLYTVRAADMVKDDNSIQNNLGQLAAWYDFARSYRLPPADQQTLDRLKTDLASSEAYAAAYKTIKDGYDRQAEANAEKERRIAAAGAEVRDAARKVNDAQVALNTLTEERNAAQSSKRECDRQMGQNPSAAERRRLQLEIARLRITLAELDNSKLPAAQKDLRDAQNAFGAKRQDLDRVRNEPVPIVPLGRLFNWLPPAVDGVVTMPADATGKPASAPAP